MFPSNHTEASLPLPEFCVNLNLRDEDSAFFTFKRTRLRNQGNLDERLVSLSRPLLSTCLKRVLCRLRISKLSVGTKSKKVSQVDTPPLMVPVNRAKISFSFLSFHQSGEKELEFVVQRTKILGAKDRQRKMALVPRLAWLGAKHGQSHFLVSFKVRYVYRVLWLTKNLLKQTNVDCNIHTNRYVNVARLRTSFQ
jgi:hypothetical protein